MGQNALVTVGTDGFVDYVQVPGGQKYMLGPVSVLSLISRLTSKKTAAQALNEFVSHNKVMLSVDLDKMWEILPYRRARYSSVVSCVKEGTENSGSQHEEHFSAIASSEKHMKKTSYEIFDANMQLAEEIVAKVDATNDTIDRLKAAGKDFDAVRAKGDLLKIASQVVDIIQDVDLAQPWVGSDLSGLSYRANEIHGLFPHEYV